MNIDFTGGSLFMFEDGKSTLLADKVTGTSELELNAKEELSTVYKLNNTAEFSCEIDSFDKELLDKYCSIGPISEMTLEYQHPIMIQARWHKKPRIRKKWLKRYGMKPDIVKILCSAHAITMVPAETEVNMLGKINTSVQQEYTFEADINHRKYVLRPDQKRKGIKIEW